MNTKFQVSADCAENFLFGILFCHAKKNVTRIVGKNAEISQIVKPLEKSVRRSQFDSKKRTPIGDLLGFS